MIERLQDESPAPPAPPGEWDAIRAALQARGVRLEPGLSPAELAEAEAAVGFQFPPDARSFWRAVHPVTGGFPNWRHEHPDPLRRLLTTLEEGIAFDVEHNDLWPAEWGRRPAAPSAAAADAKRRVKAAPPLLPVGPFLYLPTAPAREGNPVLCIRQGDVWVYSRDLRSFLLDPDSAEKMPPGYGGDLPFWGDLVRCPRKQIPDIEKPPPTRFREEFDRLIRLAESQGLAARVGESIWGQTVWFGSPNEKDARRRARAGVTVVRLGGGWLVAAGDPVWWHAGGPGLDEDCLELFAAAAAQPHPEAVSRLTSLAASYLRHPERPRLCDGAWELIRPSRIRERESCGWRELVGKQQAEVYAQYGELAGGLRPTRLPAPAVTWDVTRAYGLSQFAFSEVQRETGRAALAAFRRCTAPAEELFVLDINHTCYYFDPHAVADPSEPWPIPPLPNGDIYAFLARDYRFGWFCDCVQQTVSVFGQELLDAVEADRPAIFTRRELDPASRIRFESGWAARGWKCWRADTENGELEEFRDQFRGGWDFSIVDRHDTGACFREPEPSVTWDIAPLLDAGPETRDAFTLAVLAAFRRVVPPGGDLVALHATKWSEHYLFDPHRLDGAGREQWALPVVPDGEFAIFFDREMNTGLVGDPVARTLCVWGRPLLDAFMAQAVPGLGRVLRRDGRAVS